jgi:hypothetical protein
VSIFGGYARLNTFYKDNKVSLTIYLDHDPDDGELNTDDFIRLLYIKYMEENGLW